MERIEFTITNSRLLTQKIFGYAKSGVFPRTYSNFYLLNDEAGNTYIVSTSQFLKPSMAIKASIKGEKEYNGIHQTVLTRVSIV